MIKKISLLLFFLSTILTAQTAYNKPALIFAAGNLKFVFPQLIKEFYKKHPDCSVHIRYDSSGKLAKYILEGQYYDIYFAANKEYPEKIYTAKKSATQAKDYAQGKLILFIPSDPSLATKKISVLFSKEIQNITIANKSTAPYGVAATKVLKNAKCCPDLTRKIRYSSDVATAIDNVIWHGDAGFLSKSALYMIPDNKKQEGVDWIEVDPMLYDPIIQAYVISENGLKNKNAMQFLKFLESSAGKKIFKENGYENITK